MVFLPGKNNLKRLLLPSLLFLAVGPGVTARAAAPTLEQVCGSPDNVVQGAVYSQQCQAAYAAGNASLIQYNNAYVEGSAAVVCAYSCMTGGFTSCGTGGGACAGAQNLGNNAYAFNGNSTQSYYEAQKNGTNALTLAITNSQGPAAGAIDSSASQSAPPQSSGMPTSCAVAASSGDAQARIACAAATDPSLPAFVSSPQFPADFKQITGFSLQEVYSQGGAALLTQYAPRALENAFGQVNATVSLVDFMKAGGSIFAGIVGKIPDSDQKKSFVANIVPSAFRGLMPGAPAPKPGQAPPPLTLIGEAGNLPPIVVAVASPAVSADPAYDRSLASAEGVAAVDRPDPTSEEAEDRLGLNLFQRASVGYRRAAMHGLVSR